MNATIFWRIVWKEYRAQRAFWISMAVLTLVVELFLLVGPWNTEAERIQVMFAAALVFAAFYAMGSGATLFAAEREAETYEFLRALPVTPLKAFAGKVAFALASTAVLFGLAWTLAAALARKLPDPLFHQRIWEICGLGGIELLAWGIFFSLLLKRPLLAAIFAATGMSFVAGILCGESYQDMDMHVDLVRRSVPARLMILALVTMVDIGLAARWFRGRWFSPARPQSPRHPRLSEEQIEAIFDRLLPWRLREERAREATGEAFDLAPLALTMLGRLVWQEFRQSAAMTATLIAILLPTVLFLWVEWIVGINPEYVGGPWFVQFLPVPLFAAVFSAPLLGSVVFLADQTGCRFRFLAERGIPPRLVWLSRQIRGLVIILLGLLLLMPPTIGLIVTRQPSEDMTMVTECLLGFVGVAYACGQLCSMTIRSGIVAVAFGTVLTFLLCRWAELMYMLGLSWLWSVAPLLLAFVVTTWLHAPDWLLERKTWRARLCPALVVAVPVLAILVAIPLVRVYEIPLVGPGFDPKGLTWPIPPEEKETLALYARANELQKQANHTENGPADESARQKAEEQAVTLALEASRRPLTGFYVDPLAAPDPNAEINLADLVLASGKRLQDEGKLDAALDRYVAAERIALHARQCRPWLVVADGLEIRVCEQLTNWAAQSGQRPQRVLKSLRTMENQWRKPPTYCDDVQRDYLLELRVLEGDRDGLKELRGSTDEMFFSNFTRWLPWERARALRLLNMLTAEEFVRCREIDTMLPAGGFILRPSDVKVSPALSRDPTYQFVRLNLPDRRYGDWWMLETHRRATRLILALEAWKLEHSGLPESLEDLKGKYLDQLPVDPYTGSVFRYKPKGIPYHVAWSSPNSTNTKTLEPARPFVSCGAWSAKGYGASSEGDLSPPRPPEGSADAASLRTELWEGVWVFPIP